MSSSSSSEMFSSSSDNASLFVGLLLSLLLKETSPNGSLSVWFDKTLPNVDENFFKKPSNNMSKFCFDKNINSTFLSTIDLTYSIIFSLSASGETATKKDSPWTLIGTKEYSFAIANSKLLAYSKFIFLINLSNKSLVIFRIDYKSIGLMFAISSEE